MEVRHFNAMPPNGARDGTGARSGPYCSRGHPHPGHGGYGVVVTFDTDYFVTVTAQQVSLSGGDRVFAARLLITVVDYEDPHDPMPVQVHESGAVDAGTSRGRRLSGSVGRNLRNLSEYPRRHACDQGRWRNVARHDRARGDHTARTHRHAVDDRGVTANPHIVRDRDSATS